MLGQLLRILLQDSSKIAPPKRSTTLERTFGYANERSMPLLAERSAALTIYAGVHG